MSLFVASLNSGSNGNCYYVGNQHEAVLIDAGISCRETELRMKRLNLSLKKVRGIFITHEHFDHTKGTARLSKKYQIPVYITSPTLQQGRLRIQDHLIKPFKPYQPEVVGKLTVTAFPKFHDSVDPHSFIISNETVQVAVLTDIGAACEHVIAHFKKCHAAFLEANYDEDMLETGPYPLHLKTRIRDGQGHLSNRQALELFLSHRAPFMSYLFLAHISKNNNSPRVVENLFAPHKGDTEIVIASRYRETNVYAVHATGRADQVKQLALF